MNEIRKVAVIGSGVMGAGIAAQVANGGVPVLLLDIVPKEAQDSTDPVKRNAVAAGAVERLKKADPAAFMSEKAAKLVSIGNIDDNLAEIAGCDWIVEVVIERLDIKQSLYHRIEAARKPRTPVSSNTSTIPLANLIEGLPESFKRDFLVTHFFNPPRYMRLLEIVTGEQTDPAISAKVVQFCDYVLGKSIVDCKDSPGFIANRLGVYWMQTAVMEAIDGGLTVEEVDAIMGRPFGIPKTGVFGLIDLVGLDLMPHITASMSATLPESDPFHATVREQPLVTKMIAEGYTGRKGKGGFYRLERGEGGRKDKQAIDLTTGEYRAVRKGDLPELADADKRPLKFLQSDTKGGRYAARVISRVLAYAANLVPEAADEITAIDDAMRLGYNWKLGPFQLIDKIGVEWLKAQLETEGIPVPALVANAGAKTFYRVEDGKRQYLGRDGVYRDLVRPEGVIMLEDIKLVSKPVLKSSSASVWDIGDGVLCFEFTSKSNSLDQSIMNLLEKTVRTVKERYKALVIYNEGTNFSVGANIGVALFAANIAAWSEIETMISSGQAIYKQLKYAPFPVVSAPAGMALGGGCEILLHSDAIQAHAETYAGLVEVGVGLIPGWGGCKEMLNRWKTLGGLPNGPMPATIKVFEMISTAAVSKSAALAKEMLILRKDDGITMNRTRLLADAKAKALSLVEGYQPPKPYEPINLPGAAGQAGLDSAVASFHKRKLATDYDVTVSGALAEILTGGAADPTDPVSEDDLLKLERRAFLRLIKTPETLARIEHILETGKPLRN
jgi:3-hydroxyacyl-CoA dehydrogenase